ncbi:MAG: hypothetical protein F4024_07015 [Gammaproteobacteria bacterium]|nr:hypothetical protein [Gammaproteobacteria bacterium]
MMCRLAVLGCLGFILMAWLAQPGLAEVTEADEHGFISVHKLHIKAPPARVFEALVEEIGLWWDPAHTYSGDAANLSFDCQTRRCLKPTSGQSPGAEVDSWDNLVPRSRKLVALCEDSGDGLFVRHMTVDFVQPPQALRLSGGLGPLQPLGVAGSMTFDLEETEAGTKLSYRYRVNGRDVASWAEPVDRVQLGQLERLRRYVEAGSAKPYSPD